jgi:hypothetical protein
MSDLIDVILNDQSQTVATETSSVGATVIHAPKGGATPVYFSKKQTSRILNYFGIPNSAYPAIKDIIDYNSSYPLWVSAPSTGGRYGGVLVTKTGTVPFIGGKDSYASIDFTEFPNIESVAQAPDGLITNFTKTVSNFSQYVHQSVGLRINGVDITVAATDAEPEVLTTTPDIGSGTFTRATGVFDFTFTDAPNVGDIIEVTYDTDVSATAYFAVFNKNPQADDLKIKVSKDTSNNFALNLYKQNPQNLTSYALATGYPKTVSLTEGTKDGYGVNIYALSVLEEDDWIYPVINTSLAVTTFVNDASQVTFAGGSRGTTSATEITAGWEYFKSVSTYGADIYFDTTGGANIPAIFETLRDSYNKYKYYIATMPNANYTTTLSSASTFVTDEKGVAFYYGWAKVYNPYTDSKIVSSLMGKIALRHADMYDVFNGLAPAWYNENGTHGGQLGSGILEMLYPVDETQQEALAALRINPVIIHPSFGAVIVRERTSQSTLSDFASIGHTRLSDYIISTILRDALPYQLYKLNDDQHRRSVASMIDKILSPLVAEPYGLLRDYAIKCDEENNDDEVLAREEFVVSVAVKFTPFAKSIVLLFTNTAQGTDVQEAV